MALTYVGKVRGYLTGSFTAVPIGTPSADRIVIVAAVCGGTGGPFASMTIGGVAANRAVINAGSDGYNDSAIFTLPVTSGTTADIVCASSSDQINLYVYTATSLPSETPSSTANVSHFSTSSVLAINVPAGGFAIGCSGGYAYTDSDAPISTSANALQTVDEASYYNDNGNRWATYSAHSTGLSADAAYPVTFNENGSLSGYNSAVLAVWAVSAGSPAVYPDSWGSPLSAPPQFDRKPAMPSAVQASGMWAAIDLLDAAAPASGWARNDSYPNKLYCKRRLSEPAAGAGARGPVLAENQTAGADSIAAAWGQQAPGLSSLNFKMARSAAALPSSSGQRDVIQAQSTALTSWFLAFSCPSQFDRKAALTTALLTAAPQALLSGTSGREFFTSTGAQTWTVPAGVTSLTVEGIGGGSNGAAGTASVVAGGGGAGGGYSSSPISVTPGQTVYLNVGSAGTTGEDTWVNKSSNSAPAAPADGILAKGGGSASGSLGGSGGASASGVGVTKYSGGAGGNGVVNSGGGGGGAGGPPGNGAAGGHATTLSQGGGGGGGSGGGSAGGNPSSATGGTGGNNSGGTGGGTATNPGTDGGGGGGATYSSASAAGVGGPGTEWDASHGSGGGGGGGTASSGSTATAGALAGLYGAGGGGGGAQSGAAGGGGPGAQGIVVISYSVPAVLPDSWWIALSEPVKFSSKPALTAAVSATSSGTRHPVLDRNQTAGTSQILPAWWQPLSEPGYFKLRASLPRAVNAAGFQGLVIGDIATFSIDQMFPAWWRPFGEPVQFSVNQSLPRSMNAAAAQACVLDISQFPGPGAGQVLPAWWQPLGEPGALKRKPALSAAASASSAGPRAPVLDRNQYPISVGELLPAWWQAFAEPVKFSIKPALTVAALTAGPQAPILKAWTIAAGFKGAATMAALDKQMSISQQIEESLSRALTVSVYDGLGAIEIPNARADGVVGFGSNGGVTMIPRAFFRPGVSGAAMSIGLTINNAPSAIQAGFAPGVIYVPDCMVITGWSVSSDVAGTFIGDLWKTSVYGYPATAFSSSITGGNTISLLNDEEDALGSMSSGYASNPGLRLTRSSRLDGWQASLSPGDVLMCRILAATCSQVLITLYGYRT